MRRDTDLNVSKIVMTEISGSFYTVKLLFIHCSGRVSLFGVIKDLIGEPVAGILSFFFVQTSFPRAY